MNFTDNDIDIILYSLDVLDRYKNEFIPNDKLNMISEHISLAKTALRHHETKVHLNTVSAMHLSCLSAHMIAIGDQNADIFTINKCKEYDQELIALIDSLDDLIQNLKK